MGLFGAAHGCGWGCSLRKICHTYPIVMKLGTVIPYVKKVQKIYEAAFFQRKSANFAISRNTYIDCNFIHNF